MCRQSVKNDVLAERREGIHSSNQVVDKNGVEQTIVWVAPKINCFRWYVVFVLWATKPIAQNQMLLDIFQAELVFCLPDAQIDHGFARGDGAPVVGYSKAIFVFDQVRNPAQAVEARAGVEETPNGTVLMMMLVVQRFNGLEHGMCRFGIVRRRLGGEIERTGFLAGGAGAALLDILSGTLAGSHDGGNVYSVLAVSLEDWKGMALSFVFLLLS